MVRFKWRKILIT